VPLEAQSTATNPNAINKSMDRSDLLTDEGRSFVSEVNSLLHRLQAQGAMCSSWYGKLPSSAYPVFSRTRWRHWVPPLRQRERRLERLNRGQKYEPIEGFDFDTAIPWFLLWEVFWVLKQGPELKAGDRVLDIGGAGSLLSYFLASRGIQVTSVDLNAFLVNYQNRVAHKVGLPMRAEKIDIVSFAGIPPSLFDHAYSICVYEHLSLADRHRSLRALSKLLKPGAIASITFDYMNPRPYSYALNAEMDESESIKSGEDVVKSFSLEPEFQITGNREFVFNRKLYLYHPSAKTSYSFGACFLKHSAG